MTDLPGAPSSGYIRLCSGVARRLTRTLAPEPGDWLVGPNGLRLVGTEPVACTPQDVVLPRLSRLLQLLAAEVETFVIDYAGGEYACLAFDEAGRPLANVVARTPEEAVLRALVFVQTERAANAASDKAGPSGGANEQDNL